MTFKMKLLGAAALMTASFAMVSPATLAETVELTYSDWQLAQEGWGKSLRTAIAEFEELNPDIKVTDEPVQLSQRDVKFTTAIRAGAGPDVFALDANPVRQYIQQDWVLDLTPYAEGEDPQFFDDFYATSLEPVTVDGKVYGVPMNTVAMAMVYNKNMFAEAGFDGVPNNWADFADAMAKLTEQSNGSQWGFNIVLAAAGFDLRVSSIFHSFGASFLTEDWKHSALETPEMKAAFNYVVDLIKSGSVPPGASQVDANGARRALANGQVGAIIGTTWTIPEVDVMNPELQAWDNLSITPLPTLDGKDVKPKTTLYQKSLFINSNTKHPEAAWKLVNFLTEKAQMERWFDDNNMLSSRRSVNENYRNILNSESADVISSQIQEGTFLPLIPQWPNILETFRQNLQAAVAGSKTSDQALADAHAEINRILDEANQ